MSPPAAELAKLLDAVQAAQERNTGSVIATVVAVRAGQTIDLGRRMVVLEHGPAIGSLSVALDESVISDARTLLQVKKSAVRSYRQEGQGAASVGVEGGDVDVFFEVVSRRPQLIIVGAGHIAMPLARVADLLEFSITVVDDRPEFADPDRFPEASRLAVGPYRRTLAGLPVDSDTFIVLVTRGHVHDQDCLEQVLDSPAAYIGMIGSKRRVEIVKNNAVERGFDRAKLDAVHAPIGLDIQAQTPAEIAISIMAEIIKVRRGGQARSLIKGPHRA